MTQQSVQHQARSQRLQEEEDANLRFQKATEEIAALRLQMSLMLQPARVQSRRLKQRTPQQKQEKQKEEDQWMLRDNRSSTSNASSRTSNSSSRGLDPDKMRPSRTRLRSLMLDVAQGNLEQAAVTWDYNGLVPCLVSMQVRGVTHRVLPFAYGSRGKIGIMNTNTAAQGRYATTDEALLIKPKVDAKEATCTLAGSILGLLIPNFMHCFDIFKDGPPTQCGVYENEFDQEMVIVLQKVPYLVDTYLEELSELQDQRVMTTAAVSIACQFLLSLYAFAAFSNHGIVDRRAANSMVARTSSASIDYSRCDLFAGIQSVVIHAVPTLPKLPGNAFFGRLVMIDFGQLSNVHADNHMQSNMEALLLPHAREDTQLFNHLDHTVEVRLYRKTEAYRDILDQCHAFLEARQFKKFPMMQEASNVFKLALEVWQGKSSDDHRAVTCDVLQELVSMLP